MSSPSDDQIPSSTADPRRDDIIAAFERREDQSTAEEAREIEYERERDIRQAFRRMIDPGIMRGTDRNTALASLKAFLFRPSSYETCSHHFMKGTSEARAKPIK